MDATETGPAGREPVGQATGPGVGASDGGASGAVPDFRSVTVEALAASIRERDLTAVAVIEHALARIEALNPALGAFVAIDGDGARAQAAAIDDRLDAGQEVGPLAGIPLGVKDLADAAGFVTTKGAMHRRRAEPAAADSTEVARLRAAGCVVVGKTNTPEFGFIADTFNPLFGPTRNPWNPQRSPGGSSGGTAAAVAAGMIPAGTGSDGGGSIRIPAAACGLSGLKPSPGRVPGGPEPIGALDLSCVGPMARRIRDVALCLDQVVGPHPGDLRSLPAPAESWRAALDAPRQPARVLWAPSFDGGPVDGEIAAACAAAVEHLAAAGSEVAEAGKLFDNPVAAFVQLFYGGAILPALWPLHGTDQWDEVTRELAAFLEVTAERVSVASLFEARRQAARLSVDLAAAMTGFDVMITPTVAGQTPVPAGWGIIDEIETRDWVRFTPLFNLTRRPAGTVCCGFTADGMPIGLQVAGGMHADRVVLESLAVLEDLLDLDPVASPVAGD